VQVSCSPIVQKTACKFMSLFAMKIVLLILFSSVNSRIRTESFLSHYTIHASFTADFFNHLIISFAGGMFMLLYTHGIKRPLH
jgi:hypothetical protein